MRKGIKVLLIMVIITSVFIVCSKSITVEDNSELDSKIEKMNEEKLKKYENTMVGNNSDVVAIVSNLLGSKCYETIELHTDKEPLGLTVYYGKNNIEEKEIEMFLKDYRNIAYKNAEKMFSLISNAVYINLDFTRIGGEKIYFNRSYFQNIKSDKMPRIFELNPYKSVGNFKFGMTLEEIEKVAQEYKDTGIIEMDMSKKTEDMFENFKVRDFGIVKVVFKNDKAVIIELRENAKLRVGIEVINGNYEEMYKTLKNISSRTKKYINKFSSETYGVSISNIEEIVISISSEEFYNDITK